MCMFFLSCFLQFDGKLVTRLNETTVVFSSPPILEDPENYNITTIILMDHYHLAVKNESHSFAYVADPTFENFTDGIKKQVNKLINAKVNLSRGSCCSFCPWKMYGIFLSFLKHLPAVWYCTSTVGMPFTSARWWTLLSHLSSPLPFSDILAYLFSHTLSFPGMPLSAGGHLEMPSAIELPRTGGDISSPTRKERRETASFSTTALLICCGAFTSAAKNDPNGSCNSGLLVSQDFTMMT